MMAKKKLSRLEKSTSILRYAKTSQWCYVDTENEFNFMNEIFVIDQKVKEYVVYNKAGSVDDYTNEAYMEQILVVIDNENRLNFYNQNYDHIDPDLIRVKE